MCKAEELHAILGSACSNVHILQSTNRRLSTISGCFAGDGSTRGQAGAVAAAARELRPVEIVGLYEEQKDSMEVMLACFPAHATMANRLYILLPVAFARQGQGSD